MAKKRSDRYVKARDLAEDVRRWLADEPVDCYVEPMTMRVGRWLRRHRTWTQSIAAALFVVTIVSVVSVMIVDRARRAEQQAKAEATRRFEEARDAVDTMMTGVSEVLAYFPGMQSLREQLLTQAVERYEQFAADNSDDPELQAAAARAMIRLGDVFRGLSKYDLAQSTYEEAAKRMQQLLGVDSKSNNARVQLASAKAKLGVLHSELGNFEQSEQSYDESLRLFDDLLQMENDPALEQQRTGVAVNRAMLLNKRGMTDEALAQLEAAAKVFERLAEGNDNAGFEAGRAMTEANIANVLISAGRNGDAISHAEEAVSLYGKLAIRHPDHPPYLEALATTRLNLAAAYRTSGREREELSSYEAALADYDLLVASRSDVPLYRERQAGTERELATFLHSLGDNQPAHELVSLAIETTTALLNTQIPLAGYYEQWALEKATLGRVLSDLASEDEAAIQLGDAIERYDWLIEQDPVFSASYKMQRAATRSALGLLHQKMGDNDEAAIETLMQAADEFEELIAADQKNAAYRNGLAWTDSYIADLHWQMGHPVPARDYYQRAIQLRQSLNDEPEHLNNLARMIVSCRDPELAAGNDAIAAALQATKQAPENARYASSLGSAYARFDQFNEAIDTLRGVDRLDPRGGTTHEFWLAFALAKRNEAGDMQEARNRFSQAVTRMELHAPGRSELIRLRDMVESLLADQNSPSGGVPEPESSVGE